MPTKFDWKPDRTGMPKWQIEAQAATERRMEDVMKECASLKDMVKQVQLLAGATNKNAVLARSGGSPKPRRRTGKVFGGPAGGGGQKSFSPGRRELMPPAVVKRERAHFSDSVDWMSLGGAAW